jgi:hypothetical protein
MGRWKLNLANSDRNTVKYAFDTPLLRLGEGDTPLVQMIVEFFIRLRQE